MPTITINSFGSSNPRVSDHLIPSGSSAEALDCKLWHGTLQSWREPKLIRNLASGRNSTHYQDGCWLDFQANCVDVAQGSVPCGRIFATGYKDWPAVITLSANCGETVHRLGLPCPVVPPHVMIGAGGPSDRDIEGRSYAFQYQNVYGERSSLSPGSRAENAHDGQPVVVSGWSVPAAEYGIDKVIVYRTVSGIQEENEVVNINDTVWMKVGEVSVNSPSFTDSKYNDDLHEAVEEDVVLPPPAGLQGITDISGMNVLAGFEGNRVYFTENNSYHNWRHFYDLDDNVLAIAESNGVLYVATDGRPYTIEGAVDCARQGVRHILRLPADLAMIAQGNRHMASLSIGAAYPSREGLVLLSGNAAPTVLTWPLYSPDRWAALAPHTLIPVEANGMLFGFAQGGSFCLKISANSKAGWTMDSHTELSDRDVTQAFVVRGGGLHIVKKSKVYEWDKGVKLRPHKYISHEFVSPFPINFGAAHLRPTNGKETVTLEADGRQVFQREVLFPSVFALPNWAVGTRWQIVLEGTADVSLFTMGTTMRQLGA